MKPPAVSVILPVRNGAADVACAIDSILAQTFSEFELIVVNDGSTDETVDVLVAIQDTRVRVIHQDQMGIAQALNRGIAEASGRYIGRMDHDDRAKPTRLAQQYAFMESDPRCALLGTRAEIWAGGRPTGRVHDHPTHDVALQFELLFNNPFVHSSVLIRKSALEAVGGYSSDPMRQPPEDYELFSRLARKFKIANLPDRLTIYQERPTSISRTASFEFQQRIVAISAENIAAAVGDSTPSRCHLDVAALLNQAYSQFSESTDIKTMCHIVCEAGAGVSARAAGLDLSERVAAKVADLRYHYRLHRYVNRAGPLWPLAVRAWQYSGLQRLKHSLRAFRS